MITLCPYCNEIFKGEICTGCGRGGPYESERVEDLEEIREIFHNKIDFEGH